MKERIKKCLVLFVFGNILYLLCPGFLPLIEQILPEKIIPKFLWFNLFFLFCLCIYLLFAEIIDMVNTTAGNPRKTIPSPDSSAKIKTDHLISETLPKEFKIENLLKYFEINFSKEEKDEVIKREEEIKQKIKNTIINCSIKKKSLGVTDKFMFIKEEYNPSKPHVVPNFVPKNIEEQIDSLKIFFPNINTINVDRQKIEKSLPSGAEGWFAVPRWQLVADTYKEACLKIISLLNQTISGGCSCIEISSDVDYSERTRQMMEELELEQTKFNIQPEILIMAVQLGQRHFYRSPRRAFVVLEDNEFCLGLYETLIILLLHPTKLINDLWKPVESNERFSFNPNPSISVCGDAGKIIYSNNGSEYTDGCFTLYAERAFATDTVEKQDLAIRGTSKFSIPNFGGTITGFTK